MKSKVLYKESVEKDYRRIDPSQRIRIKEKIDNNLANNPHTGKRLKGSYEELLSMRVGDYRVLYTFIPDGILIVRVAHRKEVYKRHE